MAALLLSIKKINLVVKTGSKAHLKLRLGIKTRQTTPSRVQNRGAIQNGRHPPIHKDQFYRAYKLYSLFERSLTIDEHL